MGTTKEQVARQMLLGEKVAEVEALRAHGSNQHSEGGDYHDNVQKQGTSARYLTARLKRDAPEIAERLARGEYPSVRAAAKAAL